MAYPTNPSEHYLIVYMPVFFQWYDPYESVFADRSPVFRNSNGEPLNERFQNQSLLEIAAQLARLVGPVPSKDEFTKVVEEALARTPEYRTELTELSKHRGLRSQTPLGKEFTPNWDDMSYSGLVEATYSLAKALNFPVEEQRETLRDLFVVPFAVVCLIELDDAILGLNMGGDGTEVALNAGLAASKAMANVAALLEERALPFQQFSRSGTDARHRTNRALKAFALDLYAQGSFPSPHKASIELQQPILDESIRLGQPLSKDRLQKTIYDWLLKANRHT